MEASQDDNAQARLAARGKLAQLVFGHMSARVVATAARSGLMDLIGDDERTADELARECAAHPQALHRLLRALAALDLLVESRPGLFSLTPGGSLLRTDRPDSLNDFVRMFSDPAMLRAWEHLEDSVRTGRPAFDEVFDKDFYTHLGENPELSAAFNASMRQGTRATADALPAHYDFSRFGTVVDIGGGDGTLLAAILREHASTRGVLFDTPDGLAQADKTLRGEGVAERCTLETGDFFTSVPAGGDLYLIKSVLHNWDDDRAATILRRCREVLPEHGRLLIVEPVFPTTVDTSVDPVMYLSDLNMLVNLGGRERTRTDFEDLCGRAGFALAGITRLPPPLAFSLIEATPV